MMMKKYYVAVPLLAVGVFALGWLYNSSTQVETIVALNICDQNASEVSFSVEEGGERFEWIALNIEHIGQGGEIIYSVFGGVELEKENNIAFTVPVAICENTTSLNIGVDFKLLTSETTDSAAKEGVLSEIRFETSPNNIDVQLVSFFE